MKTAFTVIVLFVIGAGLAWLAINATESGGTPGDVIKTASGLQYSDEKIGAGKEAKLGDVVVVHYTGTFKSGKKFDSSVDRGKPFDFTLGQGEVIKGWDEGVAGMKVGGKRKLIIPPDLAYGQADKGPIPGGSTLYFDVELVDIKNSRGR